MIVYYKLLGLKFRDTIRLLLTHFVHLSDFFNLEKKYIFKHKIKYSKID